MSALKRVLIVDDDPLMPKILTPWLQKANYEVVCSTSGEDALAQLKTSLPNIILLDVQMPGMNGYSFLFELKKIPGAEKLPIVVITAKTGMSEIFTTEGVKEYLNKPVDPQKIMSLLEKHCL